MKVALVHDHLAQDGGSEKVLKIFQNIFPDAPTFVLVHNKGNANPVFLNKDIRTSFLQNMPLGIEKYQWYLPLMPYAIEKYDLMEYDVVISSSAMFAKGVITKPSTMHICYCHTPTRFLWSDTHDYVKELKFPEFVKFVLPFFLTRLRIWDRLCADRVDYFIANSKTIKNRIHKYYKRNSEVIHPPVETKNFYISPNLGNYFLAGGRLVSYKRFDLIVKAFSMTGIPLKIFGEGPELDLLRKETKGKIDFVGKVSEQEKSQLYSRALAYIHPQEEDFGISAVESMASGRPVIALGKGGALETIKQGITGEFFTDQCWEEIADYAIRFKSSKYNPEQIKQHAEQFSVESFEKRFRDFIEMKWMEYNQ